jgi:hypothetical protein
MRFLLPRPKISPIIVNTFCDFFPITIYQPYQDSIMMFRTIKKGVSGQAPRKFQSTVKTFFSTGGSHEYIFYHLAPGIQALLL